MYHKPLPLPDPADSQLWLFDPRNLDNDRLRANMEKLKLSASVRAVNTRKAYEWDWKHFTDWCSSRNLPALPATTETVEMYLTHLFLEKNARVASVNRYVIAIAHAHTGQKLPNPITASVRELIRGVRRQTHDECVGKTPLTTEQLMQICRLLARERTAMAIRGRALVLFGFSGAMRRSEIAALNLADVEIENKGLRVTIRHSKENWQPEVIGIPPGKRAVTCPVRAMKAWLSVRGLRSGPLFVRLTPRGDGLIYKRVRGDALSRVVKLGVEMLGLDPKDYGAHSLRAGFVTAGHLNGASDLAIAERTRHKAVSSLKRYLRNADPFKARDPLAGQL